MRGIVQGVGFRPFVFNLAERLGIRGTVLNDSLGVEVDAEGDPGAVAAFVAALEEEAPPLAVIATAGPRRSLVEADGRREVAACTVEPLSSRSNHEDHGGVADRPRKVQACH